MPEMSELHEMIKKIAEKTAREKLRPQGEGNRCHWRIPLGRSGCLPEPGLPLPDVA